MNLYDHLSNPLFHVLTNNLRVKMENSEKLFKNRIFSNMGFKYFCQNIFALENLIDAFIIPVYIK